MAYTEACQLLLKNAKAALSDLEKAIAEVQHNEQRISQEKEDLQQERAIIEDARQQVQKARDDLDAERATMMKNFIGPHNLVGLNFRGEKTVVMKRSVLCQIEGSMLAAMFSGRYESNLDYDKDGNVYIGYPPSVMIPLMDCLTAFQDAPPDAKAPNINLPHGLQDLWDGAVKFFGLESLFFRPPVAQMFSGVKNNLKISDLPGWRVALCKPANEITTMADFNLPGMAQDSQMLTGAKKPGEDELLLAAIGRRDVITTANSWNQHHNNVCWGFTGKVFFFSAGPLVLDSRNYRNPYHSTFFNVCRHEPTQCCWSMTVNDERGTAFEKLIMVPVSQSNQRSGTI